MKGGDESAWRQESHALRPALGPRRLAEHGAFVILNRGKALQAGS